MKNVKLIGLIGRILLVLGSALYIVELLPGTAADLVMPITVIYALSLVLLLIEWLATREERAARKAEKKAAKKAA